MSTPRPPRFHAWILRLFLRGRDAEFVLGDIEEDWLATLRRDGRAAADAFYRNQTRATLWAWWARSRGSRAERWRRELRIAARSLGRSPGYALTTVVTLALGLGGAAVVGALAGSALRPLPYPDAEGLVAVWETRNGLQRSVAPANYLDWRRRSTAFQGLAAADMRNASLTVDGMAHRGRVAVVSGNLFDVLGVDALLGRTFHPDLDPFFPELEAVISHDAWRQRFGAAPDVAGRTFRVDEVTYRVVGVAPPAVTYPEAGVFAWIRSRTEAPEIAGFPSLDAVRDMRDAWYFEVVGRLAPDADLAMAETEMASIARDLERTFPASNTGHSVLLVPLTQQAVAGLGAVLVALALAVLLVLVAAGVNVMYLAWARSTARGAESAVRSSLGASPRDLARPHLAEGLVVGVVGSLSGLGLAVAALAAGGSLLGASLAPSATVTLEPWLALTVVALGGTAGLGVGALGFLRSLTSGDLGRRLREARPGRRDRRHAIVIAQVASAIALLFGAGLLGRSLSNLAQVDPGFLETDLVTARVALPDARSRPYAERVAVYQELVESLRVLPGVTSVGFGSTTPLDMGAQAGVHFPDAANDSPPNAGWQPVSTDYFAAVGMALVQGRAFRDGDVPGSEEVAVVNQAFARSVLGDDSPLGTRVSMGLDGHDRPVTIVGVVADSRTRGPASPAAPVLYRPVAQTVRYSAADAWFAVRGPAGLVTPARIGELLRRTAPGLPVWDVDPGTELTRPFRASQAGLLSVLAVFAATALLLGVVGVYGVAAHTVVQRRRELGVRLALGASPRRVIGEVVGRGLRGAALGVAPGIALAYLLGRALATTLFGVTPLDIPTLTAVTALVLLANTLALLLPATTAARTDPAEAVRAE